jgi:secreted trypsin-like serine protease
MIMMMAATGALHASSIDWDNFNSSLIIEVTRPSGVFTCTGVAIAPDLVLTAAHCLDGEILQVRVSTAASYDPKARFWEALKYELHPWYNQQRSNYVADLAKIQLREKLPAETKIFPIIKSSGELSGKFLRLGFGARQQQNLRTLITPQLKSVNQLEQVLELEDEFSFSGDSGGPVFVLQQGQIYLVAIHSTLSYGPQGKYSFNPLLSSHRSWLMTMR